MASQPTPDPPAFVRVVDKLVASLRELHQKAGKQGVAIALADAGRHYDVHLDVAEEPGE